ncbi:MAG: phage tail protein [Calditrichaceae bacterium]|nr:phage tail protein [Calditrichia bacterium]NUQ41389.1 phage tail protein [Calditrichaceae bacterium]
MARNDPYRNFRFRVEIDGITQAGFNEVSFGDTTTEMVEYREGTDPAHTRKLSGQTKYANVTLKWGITDSTDLFDWHQEVVQKGALGNRRNLAIILVDEAGNDKSRWELEEAWPTKYDPTDFNAKGNDVAIETLEIVSEAYKRVS